MEEIEKDYNLVTETYDDWDRLIYKNYYRGVVPSRKGITSPNNKKPKKLLYQDVYVYEGKKRIHSHIKRVYQPMIDFIGLARGGSENTIITATANFSCGSIILVSGFVWSANQDSLANLMCSPPNFLVKSFGDEPNALFLRGTQKYLENNTLGQKVHSITEAGTVYFKAFAQIETGTLFSKTLSV
jgi:hypothetical protein